MVCKSHPVSWWTSFWNMISLPSSVVDAAMRPTPSVSSIVGDGHCPWIVQNDGVDLIVRNVIATCFGGKYDRGDDGQTESGWNNTGDGSEQANTFQVALPIRSTEAATRESPLAFLGPHIPWLSTVMVWREEDGEESAVKAILTDNGPDVEEFPTHAVDFNPPLALHFAPNEKIENVANDWSGSGFSYRIVGAAKYAS